jgi:hypothetical protein
MATTYIGEVMCATNSAFSYFFAKKGDGENIA